MPRNRLTNPANSPAWITSLALVLCVASGCALPLVRRVDEFRAAKKKGNYELAATYLADDPRIWFEKKEGPGSPYGPKGGPWRDWDRFFNARSKRDSIHVTNRTVAMEFSEINDFYRLIDRPAGRYRATYWFDESQRITGVLIEGLTPRSQRPPDRLAEFQLWAMKHYPQELEFLMPDGGIDPEIERARLWKKLLTEWRADSGLPSIDTDSG